MSIAPFPPASAAPPSAHKADPKTSRTSQPGQPHQHGDDAGADSGLGFLAELAAASVAIAPIVAPAPGQAGAPSSGKAGDVLGTAQGTAVSAAALAAAAQGHATGVIAGLPTALGTAVPASAGPAQGALIAGATTGTTAGPVTASATGHAVLAGQPPAIATTPAATTPATATPAAAKGDATTGALAAPAAGAAAGMGVLDPNATSTDADSDASGATAKHTAPTAPSTSSTSSTAAATTSVDDATLSALAAGAAGSTTGPTAVPADQPPAQTTAVLRQVFPEVTKAVATGPGTHRIAITLHPDDLGEVRVTVVVRGDSIRVDVATDPLHGVARTALEHGAPELRKLLEATGADAKVTFREFGTPTNAPGSATDGGRNQSFAQAQAQAQAQMQAQAEARSNGQSGQSTYAPDRSTGSEPSGPRALTTAPEDTSATTARRATSGVDQLI